LRAQALLGFGMTDERLDGQSSSHLAFDRLRHAAHLSFVMTNPISCAGSMPEGSVHVDRDLRFNYASAAAKGYRSHADQSGERSRNLL
jgi:hypothetical protein